MTREQFEKLPEVGKACDGAPIRNDPPYGHSVWCEELGFPITPSAYAVRKDRKP